MVSCNRQLDLLPTNDVTANLVYKDAAGYKQAFAKMYASFALTGNSGPNGNGDIQGIDEGTSDFLRLYWKAQELSTDEAVVSWGDRADWGVAGCHSNGIFDSVFIGWNLFPQASR